MPFYHAVRSRKTMHIIYFFFYQKFVISHWIDKKLQSIQVPAGQYVYRNTESGKKTPIGVTFEL